MDWKQRFMATVDNIQLRPAPDASLEHDMILKTSILMYFMNVRRILQADRRRECLLSLDMICGREIRNVRRTKDILMKLSQPKFKDVSLLLFVSSETGH